MLFRYIRHSFQLLSICPQPTPATSGNSYKRNNHNSLPTICFSLLLPGKRGKFCRVVKPEMVFLHKPNKGQFDPESDAWFGKVSCHRGTKPGTTTAEPVLESLRAAATAAQCRRACAKPL